jgi:hypothetical protein
VDGDDQRRQLVVRPDEVGIVRRIEEAVGREAVGTLECNLLRHGQVALVEVEIRGTAQDRRLVPRDVELDDRAGLSGRSRRKVELRAVRAKRR